MPAATIQPSSSRITRGRKLWSGHTRGGVWILGFSTAVMQWCGWFITYLLIFPLALPYWLLDPVSRNESMRYWRRVRPDASHLDRVFFVLQHLIRWGRVQCDRQLFYHDSFSYSGQGLETMREWVRGSKQGAILLSAHVGNWELAAGRINTLGGGRAAIVRVVEDGPIARKIMDRHRGERQPEVIDPRDGMGAVLRIQGALRDGRTVCMLGDRQLDLQPGVRVPFLGGTAVFSSGPFLIAGLTGCPIIVGFFMKRGRRHYHIEVDPPRFVTLPRKGPEREAALVREVEIWAQRLEAQVRRHPIQWHNFFDFWA